MKKTILGIIGCGNMGGAIARGILRDAELPASWEVLGCDQEKERAEALSSCGLDVQPTPLALAAKADYILLAVKPYQVASLLASVTAGLDKDKTILSIAAAVPLSALMNMLGGRCPAVQIMPNTPAMAGAGVFALCLDDPLLPSDRKARIQALFSRLGTVFPLPENKMNAFSAVAGCGPAYVFQMMDAVMEAAVTLGFARQDAARMVTALFRGSACLAEVSGEHPAVLHSRVTSPRGMTIAGTNHLARTAVRGHIIDAVLAAYQRGKEMEKE